jgi:hypothetical protein
VLCARLFFDRPSGVACDGPGARNFICRSSVDRELHRCHAVGDSQSCTLNLRRLCRSSLVHFRGFVSHHAQCLPDRQCYNWALITARRSSYAAAGSAASSARPIRMAIGPFTTPGPPRAVFRSALSPCRWPGQLDNIGANIPAATRYNACAASPATMTVTTPRWPSDANDPIPGIGSLGKGKRLRPIRDSI